jgi:glycine cleavage system H protein
MSKIPADLHYAKSHEWLKLLPDGTALVGITDYAQSSLGDITFVQLPAVGTTLAAGATFGVVESVKAASDLYAPVAGTVLETNSALDTAPETLNADSYEAGWMLKLRPSAAPSGLLDPAAYAKLVG